MAHASRNRVRVREVEDLLHEEQTNEQREPGEAEDDQDEAMVYMAVLFDRGQLGFAIYDAATTQFKTLQLTVSSMDDIEEAIERLYTQFDVHQVIISSRNANAHGLLPVVKHIDQKHNRKNSISVRKHADFSYVKACKAIEQIRIGKAWADYKLSMPDVTKRDAYRFMGSFFDFESVQLIRASGGLLSFLLSEKIGNQLDDLSFVYLASVERIALDGIMYIDTATLRSLQIFSHESHPSLIKGPGRAKEGFSLFGLLNRTVTSSGASLLRRWMLSPLVNPAMIDERLRSVSFFFAPENDELQRFLVSKLKSFSDISRIFLRIKKRCASVGDWRRFTSSIESFIAVQAQIETSRSINNSLELPVVFDRSSNERSICHVSNLLGNIIDLEESQQENCIVIRNGVSELLDAARDRYEDLDNVLTEVAYQIQETNPSLASITVQYIPQVGYVICCDSPTTIPDFIFQFQEDDTTFYYKDTCCRDLDNCIGDIFGFILDVQRELVEELTVTLLEHESSIYEMNDIMANLDCYISFADCARQFNLSCPSIIDGNMMKAKQARHPLQELLVEQYIPNDIMLESNEGESVIKIITGHNGSGKSVFLKMVGIIQYMAQIGCFVPAQEAEIGLVAKIFTRIQSMETATVSQSSFTIDCNQIAWMLNHGRGRSLFLIDEFGKGTAELDGIALLSSTINFLALSASNYAGQRVIITTHLLEIFRNDLIDSGSPSLQHRPDGGPIGSRENSSTHARRAPIMCSVMASAELTAEAEQATSPFPLYELRNGISSASNAFGCAIQCGIPDCVINRAREVLELKKAGMTLRKRKESTSSGPRIEEQLGTFFASVQDWTKASDDELAKLLTMARMADQ